MATKAGKASKTMSAATDNTTTTTLDGKGRQPCSSPGCPFRSLRGMKRGRGLCPFHWHAWVWGHASAKQVHPTYHDTARARTKGSK